MRRHSPHDHGLGDEGGDLVGTGCLDRLLQLSGAGQVARTRAPGQLAAVRVAGGDARGVGQPGREGCPQRRQARRRQGAHSGSVVAALARQHEVFAGFAAQQVILARQLDRRLDGLRAAGDEVGVVDSLRRGRRHAFGQLESRAIGEERREAIGQFAGLLLQDRGDSFPSVAEGDVAGSGDAVDEAPAVFRVQVDPRGALDDRIVIGRISMEQGAPADTRPGLGVAIVARRGKSFHGFLQ